MTEAYATDLQELLSAISQMIKEEEERVDRQRKFLLGAKIEAIQPIVDMITPIESRVDTDLEDFLAE